ncbi:hypothetical protein [Sphingomonas sp.]|uniref:hypothetical protein n=1 Tax=Sphingomonas sp. TaxID=28214 RepID=UPI0025DFABDD|nr:hypothetical protein [Sphingomonas sp.]MBV9528563.1 glycosyltransferase family 4 protein [Sphingomonas sp.]
MLLVFGILANGGIQTLIVRIANHLAGLGKPVAVCCEYGPLVELLDPGVELLLWTDPRDAPKLAVSWMRQQAAPITIVSFDPISAAMGLGIETRLPPGSPLVHISGVYHQRAYFMTGERRDRVLLNRLVARAVGWQRLFFQNAETRDGHRRLFGASLRESAIIPLGVAERQSRWVDRGERNLRIVSVGRLVDFKAYNVGAPQIVRTALETGRSLSWDIYGTGPLEDVIRSEIERQDVPSQVRVMGELPYARFDATVADYDLFVGCGTAALEAAMVGVPVIGVADSSRDGSYGFLHELPFGNTGELQDHLPTHRIGALIERFREASAAERQALSEQSRGAALRYGMTETVRMLETLAGSSTTSSSRLRKWLVARLYEAATQSAPIRYVRKLRARC